MDTKRPTALLTIQIDHTDLAAKHGPQAPGGAMNAHAYAAEVVMRARIPYPFLAELPAPVILRLVPGLPEQVMTCRDGDALAAHAVAFLGGYASEGPEIAVLGRLAFSPEQLYADLQPQGELVVLEPHRDPAHPGHRYVAWLTELIYGDVDDRTAGPWFAASPMAALCAAIDHMCQLSLGEAQEAKGEDPTDQA
ncbi:MAG: hypothetical protein WCI67_23230 [Chloroflexales bacterium]